MPMQILRRIGWTKAKGFHYTKNGHYVRWYEAENVRQELLGMEAAYNALQREHHRLKTALHGLAAELRNLED